ncbi:M48 family metalloprotease [Oceaniradius stylonematis]|uniref:M48 family metalloprotease n=1 Tax=Oceaniradius stylonematis TaxID=2184161 RepID=UPI003C7DED8E
MTHASIKLSRNSMTPTVFILMAGATVGALAGAYLTFAVSLFGMAAGGPVGFMIFGPVALALYAASISWVLVAAPLWTLVGGSFFAGLAIGQRGSAARNLEVTLFSNGHAITRATHELCDRLDIKRVPYVGWFPSDEINAFAMGTNVNNAMVVVSRGAVERLAPGEFLAVVAHELGHVGNNDMARMTYARGVQNALTFFLFFRGLKRIARWLFTPLSELEILRLSRTREFAADKIAAQVIGPQHMISVLEQLRQEKDPPRQSPYANLMIWSAVTKRSWLNTHPPLEDRIAALQQLDFGDVPAPVRLAARAA